MKDTSEIQHITVDLGPTSILVLAEFLLVTLKLMGHIGWTWPIVLAPIILVVAGASFILLFTLLKMIKDRLF